MTSLRFFAFAAAPMLALPAAAQRWIQLRPNLTPVAREAHAMATDVSRQRVVMAGGTGSSGETLEWDGQNWTLIKGSLPKLLYSKMSFDVRRRRCVLFGGHIGGLRQDATYEWDGKAWTKASPKVSPSARFGGGQAYDWVRGVTVHFSGLDSPSSYAADTWVYDGSTWRRVATTGPQARIYPTMCYDIKRQRCVLFGGYALKDLGDTWEWDGVAWKKITTKNAPIGRWGHTMVYDAKLGKVVMFGGYSSKTQRHHNDTWVYDGKDWVRNLTSTLPVARRGHWAAYDSVNNRTLMFGGKVGGSETWHFDGTPGAEYRAYGSGCAGTAGTPTLAAASGLLPWINRTFVAEVTNLPKTAPVAMFLGFSDKNWGALKLPFPLDGIGAKGCSLLTGMELLSVLVNSNGTAKLSVPLPNDAKLVGAQWYQQALVLDPKANAFGVTFSNGAAAKVGY